MNEYNQQRKTFLFFFLGGVYFHISLLLFHFILSSYIISTLFLSGWWWEYTKVQEKLMRIKNNDRYVFPSNVWKKKIVGKFKRRRRSSSLFLHHRLLLSVCKGKCYTATRKLSSKIRSWWRSLSAPRWRSLKKKKKHYKENEFFS